MMLLAGAAVIETPDDYIWKGLDVGTTIQINDEMYDRAPNSTATVSVSIDSASIAQEVAGKKI